MGPHNIGFQSVDILNTALAVSTWFLQFDRQYECFRTGVSLFKTELSEYLKDLADIADGEQLTFKCFLRFFGVHRHNSSNQYVKHMILHLNSYRAK
mmetsp:Transcript_27416/g.57293  ORF Transcript_27416/g.57293 Transcript_27416/m.57293 type:complete len:96 (+) Transcript_27416:375-662(+)